MAFVDVFRVRALVYVLITNMVSFESTLLADDGMVNLFEFIVLRRVGSGADWYFSSGVAD